MDRFEQVVGVLASIAIIVGISLYVASNVDCSKIPLIGGIVCVAH